MTARPRVVVLRGHSANPWELGAWEGIADRYDVEIVVTGSNAYPLEGVTLGVRPVTALRDRLPRGRAGSLAALAAGDRYLDLRPVLEGAAIVHSAEIGVWWSGQPARLRDELGFRLVLTCWETIPFRETYRRFRGRADRRDSLRAADAFVVPTERARRCLLLEGAEDARIVVSPPGIDVERFRAAPARVEGPPLIVSPGRLVWEKGHFDVLRAAASVPGDHRVLLVGRGPEEERLRRYAADLGIGERVEIRAVPYDEMPDVFARASCVVLASLPIPLWEEQFGMVLAEAMAAGAPILASTSGAIPEVLAGSGAGLFAPGDWPALATLLATGPLSRPGRFSYPEDIVERYSNRAAAERLSALYDRVLAR